MLSYLSKKQLLIAILILGITMLGCGFVDPIRETIAGDGNSDGGGISIGLGEPPTPTKTPRPTFTATPVWTPTPTVTLTPTPTPTPSNTATPVPTATPTETPVPPTEAPTETPLPTNTPRPAVPTATFTPAPPTATPTPSFPFKVIEGPVGYPTNNTILVMYISLTDGNNTPIGGLKIIGDHAPSGRHIESAVSCFDFCKVNGLEGTLKFGNVTLEPPAYETGVWNLYVIDGGGAQVSDVVPVSVDFNSPQWFFISLRR